MRRLVVPGILALAMLATAVVFCADPDRARAEESAQPLPRNHEIVEFAPLQLRVTAAHTYVIPVRATGCGAIDSAGFEFDAAQIDKALVTTTEEKRFQRIEGQREPIVIKKCIVRIEITIPGSLKGKHELVYSPTGDIVVTVKVSRDRSSTAYDLRN